MPNNHRVLSISTSLILLCLVFALSTCGKITHKKVLDLHETFDEQGAWQVTLDWEDPSQLLGNAEASISGGELYVVASQNTLCAYASAVLPLELKQDIDEVSRLELTMDYDCGSDPPTGTAFYVQIGTQVFSFVSAASENAELKFVWRKGKHVSKIGGKRVRDGEDPFRSVNTGSGTSAIVFPMGACSNYNSATELIRVRDLTLKVW
jgi:hypothetical protein